VRRRRSRGASGLLVSALALLAVLVALVAGAPPAQAHAFLTGSNPADGAVLEAAPSVLTLRFSERVLLSGSLIVFGLSASSFAIPGLLGGRRLKMVATVVYDEYLHELNWPLGAAVALVLLVANLVVMLSYNRLVEGRYKKSLG